MMRKKSRFISFLKKTYHPFHSVYGRDGDRTKKDPNLTIKGLIKNNRGLAAKPKEARGHASSGIKNPITLNGF